MVSLPVPPSSESLPPWPRQGVDAAEAEQRVVAVGAGQRVGLDIAVEPDRGGGNGARQEADAAGGAVVLGLVDEAVEPAASGDERGAVLIEIVAGAQERGR